MFCEKHKFSDERGHGCWMCREQRIADLEAKLAASEEYANRQATLAVSKALAKREWMKQAVASQAREKQMREALKENKLWLRSTLACKDWVWDWDQRECAEGSVAWAERLLALPADDTALREYVAKELEQVASEVDTNNIYPHGGMMAIDLRRRAARIRSGK